MHKNLESILSNTFKIAKYVAQVSNLSVEEKTATLMQFHALSSLAKNPNATLSEVAKYLNASLSSTTQLIERMHKSNLVTRIQDEKDRRVIRLHLTEEGKEKLSQMSEAKKERMKVLLSKLSKEEIATLVSLQKKMVEIIQDK